jgi:hypothetical protein
MFPFFILHSPFLILHKTGTVPFSSAAFMLDLAPVWYALSSSFKIGGNPERQGRGVRRRPHPSPRTLTPHETLAKNAQTNPISTQFSDHFFQAKTSKIREIAKFRPCTKK